MTGTAIKFAENVYSFKYVRIPILAQTPAEQSLADISTKLADAARLQLRQYQVAIELYQDAQALIYAQIDPGYIPPPGGNSQVFPRDPKLFPPLLSASLEWANVDLCQAAHLSNCWPSCS